MGGDEWGGGRIRGGYVGVGEFEVCYERGFLNRFGVHHIISINHMMEYSLNNFSPDNGASQNESLVNQPTNQYLRDILSTLSPVIFASHFIWEASEFVYE